MISLHQTKPLYRSSQLLIPRRDVILVLGVYYGSYTYVAELRVLIGFIPNGKQIQLKWSGEIIFKPSNFKSKWNCINILKTNQSENVTTQSFSAFDDIVHNLIALKSPLITVQHLSRAHSTSCTWFTATQTSKCQQCTQKPSEHTESLRQQYFTVESDIPRDNVKWPKIDDAVTIRAKIIECL